MQHECMLKYPSTAHPVPSDRCDQSVIHPPPVPPPTSPPNPGPDPFNNIAALCQLLPITLTGAPLSMPAPYSYNDAAAFHQCRSHKTGPIQCAWPPSASLHELLPSVCRWEGSSACVRAGKWFIFVPLNPRTNRQSWLSVATVIFSNLSGWPIRIHTRCCERRIKRGLRSWGEALSLTCPRRSLHLRKNKKKKKKSGFISYQL
ncbi:hypothetical protein FN846DRAFT_485579 [Sphaerosporella brunnea]|uniref:Uncharacterized protein n=1 Tax=Sphaerosporella brunnea TaxID=1250544 RepID=A0A5J5F4R1_9PEZI|nr:hypothetical protein FN846DRAFT_485579 [Sphaerosporella brunnea]